MSDALNIALGGLNNAASRLANSASSIVNASSTKNISPNLNTDVATNLVAISTEKTDYAANAAVVKVVEKDNKSLLDVLA